jgi:regulator of RNase E activity RraA
MTSDVAATLAADEVFARHGTAAVSDAMDLLALNGGLLGLARRSGAGVVCGPAYTLRYVPGGAGDTGAAGEFIDDVPAGAVVVIANAGRMHCTVWGDILSEVAGRRAIAGAVIDGCCRDLGEIRALGFSVWSRGAYMKSGKNRVRLAAVQEPVDVADTLVRPGDMVCADDAGALAVPGDWVDRVVRQVERVARMEALVRADIAKGLPLREARRQHGYNMVAVTAEDQA